MKKPKLLVLSLTVLFLVTSLINCACASAESTHQLLKKKSESSDCHHPQSTSSKQDASQGDCCGGCKAEKLFTLTSSDVLKGLQKNTLSLSPLAQIALSGVNTLSRTADLRDMMLLSSWDALRMSALNTSICILIQSLRF